MLHRTLRVAAVAAAFLLALPAYSQSAPDDERQAGLAYMTGRGPQYSMEGAWYGTVTIPVLGLSIPSLDTFTSSSRRPGVEGTFLCTIPALMETPNPGNPNGWLKETPSGHGRWKLVDKNKYAFTAIRTLFDENGNMFGRSKTWGTITQISENEYTGTMNVQYYLPDGTPFTPAFPGTLHSERLAITFEH